MPLPHPSSSSSTPDTPFTPSSDTAGTASTAPTAPTSTSTFPLPFHPQHPPHLPHLPTWTPHPLPLVPPPAPRSIPTASTSVYHPQPVRPPTLPNDIVTDPRDLEAAIRRRYSLDPMNEGRRVGQTARAQPNSSPEKPYKKTAVAQPLRRGDACLMCRAKKLKCSASKPTCDQCAKRKDRCIYDAIRPASRVEKLERKLAEMEEAELRAAYAARRHSAHAMLPLPVYSNNALPQMPVPDFSVYSFTDPMTSSMVIPPTQVPITAKSDESSPHVAAAAAVAATLPTTQIPWTWQNGTEFIQQPMNLGTEQVNWNAVSTEVPAWQQTWTDSNTTPASIPTPASSANQQQHQDLSGDPLAALGFVNFDPAQQVLPVPPGPTSAPSVSWDAKADPLPEGFDVPKAVMLEERDISQSAREYLLELFFCPPRQRYGSEVWSEAQFRAKMALPAGQRPHPCLLFAIYTIAASASFIPSVRQLAEPLSEIALAKIRESISNEDRLLDAINSTKMIGKWMLSRARALEAWQLTWQSASLVMACQLHKIPSSIFKPEDYETKENGANPWPLLGPPKDQWELAERIHTFWAIWGHETGSSLIIPWATAFRHETIITPFPRLPDDYLNGTIYRNPDINIRDLYTLSQGTGDKKLDFHFGYILGAAHLLHRTKRIRNEKPETNPTFRQLAQMQTTGSTKRSPIRKEYPAAYEEIMQTARWMQDNMPEQYRVKPNEERPWIAPDVPLVHECLIATRMLLHDVDGDDEEDRRQCLDAARELVALIRLWARELALDDEDPAKPLVPGADARRNRHKQGIGGAYALTAWFWAAERMAKAAAVLKKLGQEDEARKCAEDAQMVVAALRNLGLMYEVADNGEVKKETEHM